MGLLKFIFWDVFTFSTVNVTEGRLMKYLRNHVDSDERMPFAVGIVFGPLTIIILFIGASIIDESKTLTPFLSRLLGLCMVLGWFSLLFMLIYDCDVVQCLFDENSEFYRATGLTNEDILKDKGLAGEFNAYVLSKKLTIPHKTLYNVCVPMPNGNYQEVDAVIITSRTIFVVECKNRVGHFEGCYGAELWTQYIGGQQHDVPNIYLQNQEHIFAIEYFLKSQEIMPDFDTCRNFLLTGGNFVLHTTDHMPANFAFGDIDFLRKATMKCYNMAPECSIENFMEKAYMALLPYSLNSSGQKASMLREREMRAQNREFEKGQYRYYRCRNGVPVFENTKKECLFRKNEIYTQLLLEEEGKPGYWYITLPCIDYEERG